MGLEATCAATLDGERSRGTALLETTELLFRSTSSDLRARVPLAEVASVKVAGKTLTLVWGEHQLSLELGVAAETWAAKIKNPPSRLSKLGVKPASRIALVGDFGFDEATELSTRLREARITLDNINVWPNPDLSFNYHDYLEAPRSQKDMQPAKMALQVIAMHTGGVVLDSSGALDRDIERCVEAGRSFYTLTFNPPRAASAD